MESQPLANTARGLKIGPLAYLAVFIWSLGLILFAPPEKMVIAAGLCLASALIFYPGAFRRVLRPRGLIILFLLVVVMALTGGSGSGFSWEGVIAGLQMALRAVVIFVAVDGLASALEISMLAGMLERVGLRGLGFSMGVAMNLLPGMRQSIANTWHSLWMRGGLRQQRRRGLQFFLMTVLANALRQAEDIALAAEARAYSPEHTLRQPIPRGELDIVITVGLVASALLLVLL